MKLKRTLLLFPTIALLASCGGGESILSSNPGNGAIENPWWTTTGTIEKDTDGSVIYDELSISLATVVSGDDLAPFRDIVSSFNTAYRGKITVNIESINESSFDKNISDRIINGNNAPDMIMSHQKTHKSFANNKIIQPWDETITQSGSSYKNTDIVSNLSSVADLGYSGYDFNIPVDGQSMVLLYNKEILAKYSQNGVLPSTSEEFFNICKTARQGEAAGFIPFCVPTASASDTFFQRYFGGTALAQNGFQFFNEKDGKVDWGTGDNGTAFLDGINAMRKVFFGTDSIASYGNGEAACYNTFYSDKALFVATLPWEVSSILSAYGEKHGGMTKQAVMEQKIGGFSTAGIFQSDANNIDAYKIFGDSHAFALSNSVKDISKKAAALEFVNWFINDAKAGVEWAEAGHISASHAINNSEEYKDDYFVQNFTKQYYLDVNEFVCSGNTPYYTVTFDELNALITSCLDKTLTDAQIQQKVEASASSVNKAIAFIEE